MTSARPVLSRHVLVQTLISVVINSLLSLLFGLAVSHGRNAMPLAGVGGMAFDFYPQTFMITFATVTAVTLATRAQVKRGLLDSRPSRPWTPSKAVLRAIVAAAMGTIVLAPLAGFVLVQAGVLELHQGPFLVSKVAYGIGLSLIVAPLAALNGRDVAVVGGAQ